MWAERTRGRKGKGEKNPWNFGNFSRGTRETRLTRLLCFILLQTYLSFTLEILFSLLMIIALDVERAERILRIGFKRTDASCWLKKFSGKNKQKQRPHFLGKDARQEVTSFFSLPSSSSSSSFFYSSSFHSSSLLGALMNDR